MPKVEFSGTRQLGDSDEKVTFYRNTDCSNSITAVVYTRLWATKARPIMRRPISSLQLNPVSIKLGERQKIQPMANVPTFIKPSRTIDKIFPLSQKAALFNSLCGIETSVVLNLNILNMMGNVISGDATLETENLSALVEFLNSTPSGLFWNLIPKRWRGLIGPLQ